MGRSRYRWDIEVMEGLLTQLEREYEEMWSSRDFLKSLQDEVQRNWESFAGGQYQENLAMDMQEYDEFLNQLKKQAERLDEIIHRCYQQCEERISARAAQMSGSVTRL